MRLKDYCNIWQFGLIVGEMNLIKHFEEGNVDTIKNSRWNSLFTNYYFSKKIPFIGEFSNHRSSYVRHPTHNSCVAYYCNEMFPIPNDMGASSRQNKLDC